MPELYDELIERFEPEGVKRVKMFGHNAFGIEGKLIACVRADEIAFKLGRDHPLLIATFAADGRGFGAPGRTPFQDWVAVPYEDRLRLEGLLAEAIAVYRA